MKNSIVLFKNQLTKCRLKMMDFIRDIRLYLKLSIIKMLVKLKPNPTRRMVVCAILMRKMNVNIDSETLRVLNQVIDICSSVQAMRYPTDLEAVVKLDMDNLLTEYGSKKDVKSLVRKIYSSLPCWLRYSETVLAKDIMIIQSMQK